MTHAGELDHCDPVVELTNCRGQFRTLARIEKDVLRDAVSFHPSKAAAARALGIGRSTLRRKMVAYGLS